MSFATAIQSLTGPHTSANDQCAVDWARHNVFVLGNTDYLSSVGLLTGLEQIYAPVSNYSPPAGQIGGPSEQPITVDASGNVYITWLAGNGGGLIEINGVTLTQVTAGGINALPPAGFVLLGGGLTSIQASGTQYILANSQGPGAYQGLYALFNEVTYAGLYGSFGPGITANSSAISCAGKIGTDVGFVVAGPNSDTDTQKIVIQKVHCLTPSIATLASFVPSDINGAWVKIYPVGVCIDQTDGHILMWCQNANSGSTDAAVVKVDSNAGTILWNCAVPTNANVYVGQFSFSNITHQRLSIITGAISATVTTIDTSVGTSTSFTAGLAGVFQYGFACYNDTIGALVLSTQFEQEAGGPTLLNSTPTSFNGWAVLYVNPIPVPPPAPIIGSGYFIERMDNRIWAAVENVWCVDCALQTTLPTPNAMLSANTSTGFGNPTGVTDLFGGQGYSPGTTAEIVDPTGTGAVVGLTIASGIITGVLITGGTGYTYPELVFNDPAQTGAGASAVVTLDNSAVFKTSSAIFNSGMVGDIIRMGGGVATITAYTNSQQVTANITTPIAQVIPNTGGIPIPQTAGNWSIATPTSVVYGLMHLAGFTVTGVADGAVVTPRVVAADGSVTLDKPASLITLGLPFTPQFQSLYLDGGSPTIQGQRKKVAAVTVRLDASGVSGVTAGSNQPTGSAQSPPVQDVIWTEMDGLELRPDQGVPPYGSTTPPLYTGDTRAPVGGGFDRPGQVALQQNLPLPMNITAIIPEGLEGDQAEQGYQPKPQREPRGKPKGGGGRGQR